ncbi:MAG: hypothetical protein NC125_12565 [Muribaculaceae bacterium]|nr:hypothetical protein [Muribaculaceae bacterium]
MLNYKTLGHSDDFGTEAVCWVEVTGVPERFVDLDEQEQKNAITGNRNGSWNIWHRQSLLTGK